MTPEQTDAFVAEARTFVSDGVRFRHQGRSRNAVDCAGLVFMCAKAVGIDLIDNPAYGRCPTDQSLRHYLVLNFGDPIDRDAMRPGDIVLMRFRGEPSHVAIVGDYLYGGLSLIHSYAMVKKCVEHRMDAEWEGYIVEVFRP